MQRIFERKQPVELHHFLTEILGVSRLNRLDLAYDDYSGVTGFDSVIAAYDGDAFYCGKAPDRKSPLFNLVQEKRFRVNDLHRLAPVSGLLAILR
jgi:DNA relaxase NicK